MSKPKVSEPRMLKELRNLMPWTWDSRLDEHPPGDAAMRDFQNCFSWGGDSGSTRRCHKGTPENQHITCNSKRKEERPQKSISKRQKKTPGGKSELSEVTVMAATPSTIPKCANRASDGQQTKLSMSTTSTPTSQAARTAVSGPSSVCMSSRLAGFTGHEETPVQERFSRLRSSMTHDRHANSGASCWEGHTPGPLSTRTIANLRSPPATEAPCFGSPGTAGPSARSTQDTLTAVSRKRTGPHHASSPVHALFEGAPCILEHSAATSKAQPPSLHDIVNCRSPQVERVPSPPCSFSGQASKCEVGQHLTLSLVDPQTDAPKSAAMDKRRLTDVVCPPCTQSRLLLPSVLGQGDPVTPTSHSDVSSPLQRRPQSARSGVLAGNARPDSVCAPILFTEASLSSLPASSHHVETPSSCPQTLGAEPGQRRPSAVSVGQQQGGAPHLSTIAHASAISLAGEHEYSDCLSTEADVGERTTHDGLDKEAAVTKHPHKPCIIKSDSSNICGSATCGRRCQVASVPARLPGAVQPVSECLKQPDPSPPGPAPQGSVQKLGCDGPGASQGLVFQIKRALCPVPEIDKKSCPLPISPLYSRPTPPSSTQVSSVIAPTQRASLSANLFEDRVSPLVSILPDKLPCLPSLPAASSRCPPLFQKPGEESPGIVRGSACPSLSDDAPSIRRGRETGGRQGPVQWTGEYKPQTPAFVATTDALEAHRRQGEPLPGTQFRSTSTTGARDAAIDAAKGPGSCLKACRALPVLEVPTSQKSASKGGAKTGTQKRDGFSLADALEFFERTSAGIAEDGGCVKYSASRPSRQCNMTTLRQASKTPPRTPVAGSESALSRAFRLLRRIHPEREQVVHELQHHSVMQSLVEKILFEGLWRMRKPSPSVP